MGNERTEHSLISGRPFGHSRIVAEGHHLCAFPWESWYRDPITEPHEEDSPRLLLDGKPPQDMLAVTLNTTFKVAIKKGHRTSSSASD